MELSYKQILPQITTFVFDIDGVITDGRIHIGGDGRPVRNMYSQDCFAIQLALKKGLRVAVISGGSGSGVADILKGLGLTDLYLNAGYKLDAYHDLKSIYNLNNDEIAYMGDDVPDLEVMQQVVLPTCPKNASFDVRKIAKYVSPHHGGHGAVRDVIEQTLKVKSLWNPSEDHTW